MKYGNSRKYKSHFKTVLEAKYQEKKTSDYYGFDQTLFTSLVIFLQGYLVQLELYNNNDIILCVLLFC